LNFNCSCNNFCIFVCWILVFFAICITILYYFLEFDKFIFSFYNTHNNQFKKRYKDDSSIYPDLNLNLWLEEWLSDGLDRNRVYELFNTIGNRITANINVIVNSPTELQMIFYCWYDIFTDEYTDKQIKTLMTLRTFSLPKIC
jgi:hypothetical protein